MIELDLEEGATESKLCRCGANEKSSYLHGCPYREEIHDDYDSLCDCCDDCTHDCAMDV